jgi:protocatechuate 3,4-dioxygenase beta subunit
MVPILSRGVGVVALYLAAYCAANAQSTITGLLQQKRGDSLSPVRHCTVYASSATRGPLVGEYPGEQGRFRLDFPSDPRVAVGAICDGFRLSQVNGETIEAGIEPAVPVHDCANPGLCAELLLVIEPLAAVEGDAVDDSGGSVEGIHLALREVVEGPEARVYHTVSDDRGYFRFFHLPPGEYELVGDRSAQQTQMLSREPQRLTVRAGETVSAGQIRVPSMGSLMPMVTSSRELQPPGAEDPSLVSDGVAVASVRDAAGNPLPGATVVLHGNSSANQRVLRRAVTDAAGQARIDGLPNGVYWVEARIAGRALSRPGGHSVDLQGAGARGRVELQMRGRPVLTGRVVDEHGTPMPDTRVQLYSVATSEGQPVLTPGVSTTTDDRGVYRLSVTDPGRYWVMATHMEATFPLGSAPRPTGSVFYPNSPDLLGAQPADLAFDQSETAFDITLPPAPRTEIAAGLLSGPGPEPCAQCIYSLRRVEGEYDYELIGDAISGRLPGFEYRGIPPGNYRILVEDRGQGALGWWAIEDVTLVEDRPLALAIETQPPVTVVGRLALEDPPLGWRAENRDRAGAVQIQLAQLEAGFFTVFNAAATFTNLPSEQEDFRLGPLPPGKFRIEVWLQGLDAYIAGVALSGRALPSAVLDFSQPGSREGLEIRMRFDLARPAFRVPLEPMSRKAWTTYRVVLIPDAGRNPFGYPMEGYCGPDGSCEIGPVPPGRYWAMAYEQRPAGISLRNAELRKKLAPWGREINLTPGENSMIELKLAPEKAFEGL